MKHFSNSTLLKAILILSICSNLKAQNYQSYPENILADTLHAPFYHGVASADPLTNKVLLWTRISPGNQNPDSLSVYWEISSDSNFTSINDSGTVFTKASKDWTLSVDAENLTAGNYYFYRFQDNNGNYSVRGRTKTAPANNVSQMQLAVASCSSIFSGFFNAYARIAENDSIDLVVHLGDYIYDFVDADEEVRLTDPYPVNVQVKEEWRNRQSYYLLDPDLRKARQMHPFIVIWDNHDVDYKGPNRDGSIEAFNEWIPYRKNAQNEFDKIYRSYSYGNLLDLIMMDVHLYKDQDVISNDGDFSYLGNEQYDWFINELTTSTSKWRILGSQKMFGGFYAKGLPEELPVPRDGDVFNANSWDGYMLERERILKTIRDSSINNVMVLSGDMHFTTAMNLVVDPFDTLNYNAATGDGAVGTEFLPTSISRGNFDEQGIDPFLADAFIPVLQRINPQIVHMELVSHGYGILKINENRIAAEYHYCPILEQSTEDILAKTLIMEDGANKWNIGNLVTNVETPNPELTYFVSPVFPNPVDGDAFYLDINTAKSQNISYNIISSDGKILSNGKYFNEAGYNNDHLKINATKLGTGIHFIEIKGEDWEVVRKFIRY